MRLGRGGFLLQRRDGAGVIGLQRCHLDGQGGSVLFGPDPRVMLVDCRSGSAREGQQHDGDARQLADRPGDQCEQGHHFGSGSVGAFHRSPAPSAGSNTAAPPQ